jgi:hypothetical protein
MVAPPGKTEVRIKRFESGQKLWEVEKVAEAELKDTAFWEIIGCPSQISRRR